MSTAPAIFCPKTAKNEKEKYFSKKFKKPLDKPLVFCYNVTVVKTTLL